jgi:hypothetical protein
MGSGAAGNPESATPRTNLNVRSRRVRGKKCLPMMFSLGTNLRNGCPMNFRDYRPLRNTYRLERLPRQR